jgi:hypothetical protein
VPKSPKGASRNTPPHPGRRESFGFRLLFSFPFCSFFPCSPRFGNHPGDRARRPAAPRRLLPPVLTRLLLLDRLEVVAQILDALAHRSLVLVFQVLEDRPPHRHLRRAVRGEARPKSQHADYVVQRKLAAVPLAQCGQIRQAHVQVRRRRAVAFAPRAVARGAVLLVHRFARRNVAGRKLRARIVLWRIAGALLPRRRRHRRRQQQSQKNYARAVGHDLLPRALKTGDRLTGMSPFPVANYQRHSTSVPRRLPVTVVTPLASGHSAHKLFTIPPYLSY